MRRLLPSLLVLLLASVLAACGVQHKSVYPPGVSIQQLVVLADGQWRLTLRVQNNSYDGVNFTTLDGELGIGKETPILLRARFNRDIPALSGDVVDVDVLPTPAMAKALAAVGAQGSAGTLQYRLAGSMTGQPEQDKKPRELAFHGSNVLSPVPGIAHTFR